MAGASRKAVLFCQGGRSATQDLAYRRLLWAAEAQGSEPECEVHQACQAEGAATLVRAARALGAESFILAACPRASAAGGLGLALSEAGLLSQAAVVVDVFDVPPRPGQPCRVREGAVEALRQAMIAAAAEIAPTSQPKVAEQKTLVVGDGLAALLTAESLADSGRPVVLLSPGRRLAPARPWLGPQAEELAARLARGLKERSGVEIVRRGRLVSLLGTAGDFTAMVTDAASQPLTIRLGAVVVAQFPPLRPNLPTAWVMDSRVVTLRELWALMSSPEHFRKTMGEGQEPRVGLFLGLGADETTPLWLRCACLAAMELMQNWNAQVTLGVNTLKVAAPGLEVLTQQVRSLGALMVRLPKGGPRLEQDGERLRLTYFEDIIGREVEEDLDLLVVDDVGQSDESWRELARVLGLQMGRLGGLQPEAVTALPVQTGRAGVMAVGPARGLSDWTGWSDEAGEAALQVERLLGGGEGAVMEAGRVVVDRRRCAICLTCVRVCPRGAMGRRERRPFSNPLVCTACGTCAAECPMDAIQIAGADDGRYAREIDAASAPRGGLLELPPPLELLVLACANSAGEAIAAARLRGEPLPEGTRLVSVPCAGKIDPSLVLGALRQGFAGVLLLACFPGACYSQAGNVWAELRLDHLRGMLLEAGLEPRRVMSASAAPNGHLQALEALRVAWAELAALGPNPITAAAQSRDLLSRFTVRMDHTYVIL
jgi:heterodisulfide reductase subunit A-like polyferredoxin/coenzyme F420-reducing hydrogenase delta subunit